MGYFAYMAQGKKTSSKKKANIITEKIKNPDLSSRDIKEIVWDVSHDTVCDVLNSHLPQLLTESEIIKEIVSNDLESVRNMSAITKKFTEQTLQKEELDRNDISVANTTTDSAFKRSQLLTGWPTERHEVTSSLKKLNELLWSE